MSLSFWLNPVNVYVFVRDFYYEKLKVADPRLDGYPLMSSPIPSAILIGLYLLFVLIGPRIMEHRQPVNVKIPMMIYNLSMVILSYYLFHELLFGMLDANFTFLCDPIDYSNDPKALRLVSVCWLYFFSKFIEFTDTVFFILRKKNNQVSFLHVYHHSSVASLWWVWAKWGSGGTSCLAPSINCGIHVIMYSYYFLSGLGPQVQKYLWWKKYITVLQLIQFVTTGCHTLYITMTDCDYPTGMKITHMVYLITLIILFSNFYIQSYTKNKKKSPPVVLPSENGEPASSQMDKKHK